ncbi:MAG: mechanosensitive ion channel family protein [bacterium]
MTGLLVAGCTAAAGPTRAADDLPDGPEDAAVRDTAPVTIDGRALFRVRGVSAYPAAVRAAAIRRRIEQLAADPTVSPDSVVAVETPERSEIRAGDVLILGVYDADAALEDVRRDTLAEGARRRIAEAIRVYRHEREPRLLTVNGAYALAALLAAALLALGIRLGFRRLEALVDRRFRARIERLQAQSFEIIQAEHIRTALRHLLRAAHSAALLLVAWMSVDFVLGLFPWTRPLALWLWSVLVNPLAVLGKGVVASFPDLVLLAFLAIATRWVLRATQFFFEGVARGTIRLASFERDWALPTYRLVRVAIIAFALVVAYPYVPGSGSEAFKGISIFLGVLFSLGSSSFIGNVIAGYAMIYRRTFQIGDRIQVGDVTGDVVESRLMVTRLRTVKNEEVVLPNSLILSGHVINYSTLASQEGLILHTTVGIGYETPWRQVEAMLTIAAGRTPGLRSDPPPFVLQKALGDFAVAYELNVYCDEPRAMGRLYTALHQNILDVFNEHGVQIMTPNYEADPKQPKLVPKDQWFQPPAGRE